MSYPEFALELAYAHAAKSQGVDVNFFYDNRLKGHDWVMREGATEEIAQKLEKGNKVFERLYRDYTKALAVKYRNNSDLTWQRLPELDFSIEDKEIRIAAQKREVDAAREEAYAVIHDFNLQSARDLYNGKGSRRYGIWVCPETNAGLYGNPRNIREEIELLVLCEGTDISALDPDRSVDYISQAIDIYPKLARAMETLRRTTVKSLSWDQDPAHLWSMQADDQDPTKFSFKLSPNPENLDTQVGNTTASFIKNFRTGHRILSKKLGEIVNVPWKALISEIDGEIPFTVKDPEKAAVFAEFSKQKQI